jgi:hypothetical protein
MNQLVTGHAWAQTDSPFVSALSLPMFNRPAPRWGNIGQPQGILNGLFGVVRGAMFPDNLAGPLRVWREDRTGIEKKMPADAGGCAQSCGQRRFWKGDVE